MLTPIDPAGARAICALPFFGKVLPAQGAVAFTVALPWAVPFYTVNFMWSWNCGNVWFTVQTAGSFTVNFAVPAPAGAEVIWQALY